MIGLEDVDADGARARGAPGRRARGREGTLPGSHEWIIRSGSGVSPVLSERGGGWLPAAAAGEPGTLWKKRECTRETRKGERTVRLGINPRGGNLM
jgi:hypothetical protein